MERQPAINRDHHEDEPIASEIVQVGSLVTIKYGGRNPHQATFLIVPDSEELPNGFVDEALPEGVRIMSSTTPLSKRILDKSIGYTDDHFRKDIRGGISITIVNIDNGYLDFDEED